MTPKNPDRFERIVLAAIKKQDTPESPSIWLNGPDVVKLLRREYRWMVRMITTEKVPPFAIADVLSRRGLLDRLTRRAR